MFDVRAAYHESGYLRRRSKDWAPNATDHFINHVAAVSQFAKGTTMDFSILVGAVGRVGEDSKLPTYDFAASFQVEKLIILDRS